MARSHAHTPASPKHDTHQPEASQLDTASQHPDAELTPPAAMQPARRIHRLEIHHLQRTVGNRAVARSLASNNRPKLAPQLQPAATPLADQPVQRKPENEQQLKDIQGQAMFALLPKLRALGPAVLADEAAGSAAGGPRLVTAMRVAMAGGANWLDFAAAHNGELATLPADQIADIITFMGAPKDSRYFKAEELGGKFDGAVDPATGELVLFYRVRFEIEGARFSGLPAGSPEWEAQTKAELVTFKAQFKQSVEQTWKGTLRPTVPIGKVTALRARVAVIEVDSQEHTLFHILTAVAGGRAHAEPGDGTLSTESNTPHQTDKDYPVMDDRGKPAGKVSNTQTTSAHEFGHTVGLHHPQGKEGGASNYGKTADERESIMGAGHTLKVIRRGGKIRHNDFAPFVEIATRWGRDILPGALAGHNTWSGGE